MQTHDVSRDAKRRKMPPSAKCESAVPLGELSGLPHDNVCRNYLSRRSPSCRLGSGKAELNEGVRSTPRRRQSGCPIFSVDRFSRVSVLIRGEYPRRRGKLGPRYSPSDGARRNPHLRIITNALCLSHIAAGHYIQSVSVFSEPYRSRNRCSVLAKGGKRDVFLAADRSWNCFGHDCHCRDSILKINAGAVGRGSFRLFAH